MLGRGVVIVTCIFFIALPAFFVVVVVVIETQADLQQEEDRPSGHFVHHL